MGNRVTVDPEIIELCQKYEYSVPELNSIYLKFKSLHPTGVSLEMFSQICSHLGIALGSLLVDRLFKIFDHDHDGTISFSDFVHLISIFKGTTHGRLKLAYSIYDIDGDGSATRQEVLTIATEIFEIFDNKQFLPDDADTPEKIISKFFAEVDEDNDGEVTWDEFNKAMKDEPFFTATTKIL